MKLLGYSIFLLLTPALSAFAQNYYVSGSGSDSGPGSAEEPFLTIQHSVGLLEPGDTLFIRGGSYHEEVLISNLSGTPGSEIVITAYPGEEVILDGTIPIETTWDLVQGNIYSTTIDSDIWQLFVDGQMQVVARWPDAATHPCDPVSREAGSREAETGTWWSRSTTWANADAPGTQNGVVENNPSHHDLAATGKSFLGGSVLLSVLEQGGDGNQERPITAHEAGSNTFFHPVIYPPKPDKAYRKSGKYYIIEHPDLLDQPGEWYFIDSTNTIYLWPEEGIDPNTRSIRGRNHSRAFTLSGVAYIKIKGLNFFASNFSVHGDHVTVEDCSFDYPDASRRLVGVYPENSTAASVSFGTYVEGEWFSLENCEFRYSEYNVLKVVNGTGSRIENNLFYNVSMLGLGKNGAIEQVNTYTRNSLITAGNRGAVKTNTDPVSGRQQDYNLFDGLGFLQVPDGASLQAATSKTPGTIRAFNWYLNANKYGARWDGKPAGNGGLNHHSVGVLMRATLQIKGNGHRSFNNSSFDSDPYNDIIILSDQVFGGNEESYTFNNLADRIAGHRSESVFTYPLPGTHGNNWNGYKQDTDANIQVRDVANRDFRPRPGSEIVDAGIEVPGISDGFLGLAPDVGAYEFGDSVYWIPGRKMEGASSPVPLHKGTTHYEFVDLMWLEGYGSHSSDVYFGSSGESVEAADRESPEFAGNQINNIFYPGPLEAGLTYYWRIDALRGNETIKGDTWSFTAGMDANPVVHEATFRILGVNDGVVHPLEKALIKLCERKAWTDSNGGATFVMLAEGTYSYEVARDGYMPLADTLEILSDTSFADTLALSPVEESFQAGIRVIDMVSEEPLYRAYISFGERQALTDSEGSATLENLQSGYLVYTVEHDKYFSLTDSVMIRGDTVLVIRMTSKLADIQFDVSDELGPVRDVLVMLDGMLSLVTDGEGIVIFNRPARQKYGYSVSKEGYEHVADTLYLETDTAVAVSLQALTGTIDLSGSGPHIYPNPATDELLIRSPFSDSWVELISPEGKVLMEKVIAKGENRLDLTRFQGGVYYLRIRTGDYTHLSKLVKY